MGKPAYPLRYKLIAFAAAGLLACGLLPMLALADDSQDESVAGPLAGPGYEGNARSASPNSALLSNAGGPTLASTLASSTASIVSADVALDSAEPVVGSFTADGLTYAVGPDGLALVAVGASAVSDGVIAIPATVTYDDATYPVTAVGPYAFYLSGAASVDLPASVTSVDDRAFRSSDVERIEVASDNPNLASFDGCLYDSQLLSLLLIPEGRAGAVLLPCEAEVAESSKFSHCSLVDAIDAGEGGAAFASWEGLLYDASGTTLLRVPAGATEITIRDGCTTIAAGAMEGCVKLERINAPASVTSISPDLFESVPTVSLPAQMAVQDATNSSVASSLLDQVKESTDSAPQLTAMVALSTIEDDMPKIDGSSVSVALDEGAPGASTWLKAGFKTTMSEWPSANNATVLSAETYAATQYAYICAPATCYMRDNWSGGNRAEPYDYPYVFMYGGGHGLHDYRFVNGTVYYRINPTGTYYCMIGLDTSCTGVTSAEYTTDFVTYHPLGSAWVNLGDSAYISLNGARDRYPVALDDQEADVAGTGQVVPVNKEPMPAVTPPQKNGYAFKGYWSQPDGQGECFYAADGSSERNAWFSEPSTLYAKWVPDAVDVVFDTSTEPSDEGYPGDKKDDQTINAADGQVPIEDPKRPGYVFEGWVIPNADDTEAVDQELVYQGGDKKWYVDASKLPGYADGNGKVQLTARWTAALSVDAPISATFMYDLSAWDGGQARDAYVEGSSTVKNRSAVPIRVSGIESAAGDAASVLKRSDGTTMADAPQGDAAKVLSVFPTASSVTGTEGDAKAPASDDAADDLAHKVDLSLSDVKLEAAFDHGAWAVDAATVGDNGVTVSTGDLKLGYRLNLGSATGITLDQDALLAVTGDPDAGAVKDAAIANLTYCFAAEGLIPTGAKSDPLWVEVTDPEVGSVGVYGLSDIKRAADDFSSRVDPAIDPNDQDAIYAQLAASPYFELFRQLLEHGVSFQVKVDGHYLPLQLLGICQDTKTADGKRAGLTFQMRDIYAYNNTRSTAAGGGAFNYTYMNSTNTNSGGWESSALRGTLRSTFWGYLPAEVQDAIAPVNKYQQLYGGTTDAYLQKTTGETVWLPSMYEVFGASFSDFNDSETLSANDYTPFQYMAYHGNVGSSASAKAVKVFDGFAGNWWLRSAFQRDVGRFCYTSLNGNHDSSGGSAFRTIGAAPCFCL